MEKIRIGISTCLLGEKVRYDGQHKWDRYITDTLGQFFEWVPVCPEVEYGLPIPRESLRLVGDPKSPRLLTTRTGVDHTEGMKRWSAGRLNDLAGDHLCGFIFKSRSPSSGMAGVKVYKPDGMPNGRGSGIFAAAFMERFPLLPVIDEGRLHDLKLRENFIERVFVYRRWREFVDDGFSLGGLVTFHTRHKLLIMAHSPRHYRDLGTLVAHGREMPGDELVQRYLSGLMAGLGLLATVRKNTNVLQHIMGYFKKHLAPDEKQELLEIISAYHDGHLPLIAPVVLLNHYVRKYGVEYLQDQYFLHPHPLELQLRNHV